MNAWLMKTEPETFSWDDLVRSEKEPWDGVRNFQARNHMVAMQVGDLVLVYHSGKERQVVGIGRVAGPARQDPKTDDPRWKCVDVSPVKPLVRPVTLAEVKADPVLSDMVLARAARLSVQPVRGHELQRILELSGTTL